MRGFKPHQDDFDIALQVKELQTHTIAGVRAAAQNHWRRRAPIAEAVEDSSEKQLSAKQFDSIN